MTEAQRERQSLIPEAVVRVVGRFSDHRHHVDALILGVALSLGFGFPLIGGRPVFLLDWVVGPRYKWPTSLLGLNGGLTTGALATVSITLLGRLLGNAATWVPLILWFPVASVGISRLVGGWRWGRLGAVVLYCVNPWVFSRIYAGHVPLIWCYALLPYAVSSLLDVLRADRRLGLASLKPALWWALLTALAPHLFWIYGLVLVTAVVVQGRRPALVVRRLRWLGAVMAAQVAMTLYIYLPHSMVNLPVSVGSQNLSLYRTSGDPTWGLFVNVVGLYGFWRTSSGPVLPKAYLPFWPLLLLIILGIVAVGILARMRRRSYTDRRQAHILLLGGVGAYFLSLGDQGPTGFLFRWAYSNVPFFDVMREPQKFLMLTALLYATGFSWGMERLRDWSISSNGDRRRTSSRVGYLGTAALALLPLAYSPTIFDGLGGQISPSTIPESYRVADALMGAGSGRILYLPWHLYEAQPFTGHRVVANIGPTVFRRSVIAGDDLEAGSIYTESTSPRSAYLQNLFAAGSSVSKFGSKVAPLGVKYVVLAKIADWRSFQWLGRQTDLERVYEDSVLEVWRNLSYSGQGTRNGRPGVVIQRSPIAYTVGAGQPGLVTIDAVFQRGWQLDGISGSKSRWGTVEFHLHDSGGGMATFEPWQYAKGGYLESTLVFVLLLAAIGVEAAWRGRRVAQGSGDWAVHGPEEFLTVGRGQRRGGGA